jgi:hypothetical protein
MRRIERKTRQHLMPQVTSERCMVHSLATTPAKNKSLNPLQISLTSTLSGSGSLALGFCCLVCSPSGWILRLLVQGFGLPMDDAWHMVLGPGRFQLAGFLGGLGFMTQF